MVWQAYKKVRANKGSAGVDQISMEAFDANRSQHLYKLWNRMASGSYFPPAVKEVEISKTDGSIRKLGIPTISDRVGQMVVKMFLEPRLEKIFSPNSFGYRPNKSAHQALKQVRENCWKTDNTKRKHMKTTENQRNTIRQPQENHSKTIATP